MTLATIMGLLAGLITSSAFLPQIIKTFKTKDTRSISLLMLVTYLVGVMFWFIYAVLIGETAILITNTFSFVFGVVMLFMKLKFK